MKPEQCLLCVPSSMRAHMPLHTLPGKEQRAAPLETRLTGLEEHTLESEPIPGAVKLQLSRGTHLKERLETGTPPQP